MKARKITENIFGVHANLTHTEVFEGFWKIPHGVSLNSYIVRGNGTVAKTALIDLVCDCETAPQQLQEQLQSIGIQLADIDYLILNHLEPDHVDFLQSFLQINKTATILTTKKGCDLLEKFFKVKTGFRAISDGEILNLGEEITLQFFETPNVHWPETMMTYEISSQTLFSCDAFGSYGKVGEKVFDDELAEKEHSHFEQEMLRYYSNIVASFSVAVKNALQKLAAVPVKTIAPSHGIIWRSNPHEVIQRYARYAGYNTGGEMEKEICVIWGSMYGSTQKGVNAVIAGIQETGIPYSSFEIPSESFSEVLAAALRAKALVLAMPTYEYKMYPPMAHLLDLFARKHFYHKTVFRIGSWGWVGGAKREYDAITESFRWNRIEAYEWQGIPSADDLKKLHAAGKDLAKSIL